MQGSETDGVNFTATPRFGKVFNLGRNGNLAVFAGGNFLDSDLTVAGFEATPDGLLEFNYVIEQQNKDKWNALLGLNWDINKRLSWAAEYDGIALQYNYFRVDVDVADTDWLGTLKYRYSRPVLAFVTYF